MFQHELTEAAARKRGATAAQRPVINRKANGTLQDSLLRLQRDLGNHSVGVMLHRAAAGSEPADDMAVVEKSIEGARGGGQQMDTVTRDRVQSAFGVDFGAVRVHTDARADGLSRALNARAFTTGNDVFFKHGEYDPGASGGRELLAHELTHVVQQSGAVQRSMTVSQPGDPHEVEAEQVARAVVASESAQSAPAVLQRQPEALSHEDEEKKKLHRQVAQTPDRDCHCSGG